MKPAWLVAVTTAPWVRWTFAADVDEEYATKVLDRYKDSR